MSRALKRWQSYVRRAHVRHFGGLELCVYPSGDDEHDDAVFRGLIASLCLIYDVQPWRAKMLPRHITRILSVYPLGAEYVPEIRACVIGYKAVGENRIQQVAKSIVHEFTHARIENCGIAYTEDTRARIEHLCFKAETNFQRAAVSAPRLTRGQVPAIDAWWTEEHRVERIQAQLRELRVPEWIVAAASFVYHVRHRFGRRKA